MFSSDGLWDGGWRDRRGAPLTAWVLEELADGGAEGADLFPDFGDAGGVADFGGEGLGRAAARAPSALPNGISPEAEATWRAAEAARLAEEAARAAEAAAELRERELADAYAAGVEDGRAEGAAAARRELDAVVGALMQALADVRGGEQRWLAALEENVAALGTAVARHVIAREVSADPALAAELARRAIAEYPPDEPLTLRAAPADVAALKAAMQAAPKDSVPAAPTREIRWLADPRVERGGVLVEGRERIVDGRVDTALERVYRRLSNHQA